MYVYTVVKQACIYPIKLIIAMTYTNTNMNMMEN